MAKKTQKKQRTNKSILSDTLANFNDSVYDSQEEDIGSTSYDNIISDYQSFKKTDESIKHKKESNTRFKAGIYGSLDSNRGNGYDSDSELYVYPKRNKTLEDLQPNTNKTLFVPEIKEKFFHTNRLDFGQRNPKLVKPRNQQTLKAIAATCDQITLRLSRLPVIPYHLTKDKDGESIFGEKRDFQAAMSEIFTEFYIGKNKRNASDELQNAFSYIQSEDTSLKNQKWCEAQQSYDKHYPEWLHLIANSLGGPIAVLNGVAGSHAANTQMEVIENAIAYQPGIGVEVTAYMRPGTRVAEYITYKVIAYGEGGKELAFPKAEVFDIDARRQWYDSHNANQDHNKIKLFLERSSSKRSKAHVSDFELPEIMTLDLIDFPPSELRDKYLELGPMFATTRSKEGIFSNYNDNRILSEFTDDKKLQVQIGRNRYVGYRQRTANAYIFHDQQIRDLMADKRCTNLDDFIQQLTQLATEHRNMKAWLAHAVGKEFLQKSPFATPQDIVTELVNEYVDNFDNNLLCYTVKFGNLELVKDLVNNHHENFGIKGINKLGMNVLDLAIQHQQHDIVDFLIDKGAKPSQQTLLVAAQYGNAKTFEALEKLSVVWNPTKQKDGPTALQIAARYGNQAAFEFLQKKCDIKSVDYRGNTVVHELAQHVIEDADSHDVILSDIHDKHPELINIQNHEGQTPLHLVAQVNPNSIAIKLLIESYGADPLAVDKAGNTPLHLAVIANNLDAIHAILSDTPEDLLVTILQTKNKQGYTPIEAAIQADQYHAVEQLCTDYNTLFDQMISDIATTDLIAYAEQYKRLDAKQALVDSGIEPKPQPRFDSDDTDNSDDSHDSDMDDSDDDVYRPHSLKKPQAVPKPTNTGTVTAPASEKRGTKRAYEGSKSNQQESVRPSETEVLVKPETPSLKKNKQLHHREEDIDPNYEYTDGDISKLVDDIVIHKLGGYKTNHHYLLESQFREGDLSYHVAIIPAIDTQGANLQLTFDNRERTSTIDVNSIPLDYYFDQDKYEDDVTRQVLKQSLAKIEKCQLKHGADIVKLMEAITNETGNRLDSIYGHFLGQTIDNNPQLIEKAKEILSDTDINIIQRELAHLLENSTKRHDVIDELKPFLENNNADIKILLPYNIATNDKEIKMTSGHWLTAEIIIHKRAHHYQIEFMVHDPYGTDQSEAQRQQLKIMLNTIAQRIRSFDKEAEFKPKLIHVDYRPRQDANDSKSCGVITTNDLIKRAKGETLDQKDPYPIGAIQLRLEHQNILVPNAQRIVSDPGSASENKVATTKSNHTVMLSSQQLGSPLQSRSTNKISSSLKGDASLENCINKKQAITEMPQQQSTSENLRSKNIFDSINLDKLTKRTQLPEQTPQTDTYIPKLK